MNDQQETTAKSPSDPKLCRMGCGFFGSNATGDCCSKCFNEMNTAREVAAPASVTLARATPTPAATVDPAPAPGVQAPPAATAADPPPAAVTVEAQPAVAMAPTKKKKKKKASYRNMIAGMMEQTGPRDTEKEKEGIRKVTGGGAFTKIDKI